MARCLYTLFYYLITPIIVLRLLWRSRKAPAYRQRIGERFGFFKAPSLRGSIWLHTVSVGETIAAVPLVKQLQKQYPHKSIVVTTMTPTGSERVKALLGDSVFHVYAPYDLPGCIKRFLARIEPSILIIMETELWPNTIELCAQRYIPVLLVNARLSQKSAAGYQRFAALSQPMLRGLSGIAAQTEVDASRFVALGFSPERMQVTGSIKFDIAINEALQAQAQKLKAHWQQPAQRLVWIAASTHEGEDEIILAAHKQLLQQQPQALLVLVPRHPERFKQVAMLIEQAGFSAVRRSEGLEPALETQVYLADTMGEMMLLLGASDIAVVGGSFIASGGHNMLEPAAWGLPIITGESDYNFLEISALLQQAQALTKVADANALAAELLSLTDQSLRQQRGTAAMAVVEKNRGSLQRLLALLQTHMA
jgi:3-deoxy-D-manno-octulosonic-acid transferase